jgi:hypothetical protein
VQTSVRCGDFGTPHSCKLDLGAGDIAGMSESNWVLGFAGNFTRKLFGLLGDRPAQKRARGKAVLVALWRARFLPARERGPVLLPALRRLAAICRSLAMD